MSAGKVVTLAGVMRFDCDCPRHLTGSPEQRRHLFGTHQSIDSRAPWQNPRDDSSDSGVASSRPEKPLRIVCCGWLPQHQKEHARRLGRAHRMRDVGRHTDDCSGPGSDLRATDGQRQGTLEHHH
jgi:hypothetical protein